MLVKDENAPDKRMVQHDVRAVFTNDDIDHRIRKPVFYSPEGRCRQEEVTELIMRADDEYFPHPGAVKMPGFEQRSGEPGLEEAEKRAFDQLFGFPDK